MELSIVLVILGLLTGGILGGQSLIHAAELRKVSVEYQEWQTAINTFKDKYFQLPGDMNNAIQFWGNADDGTHTGECADNDADAGTGTETCNGDGNGLIDQDHENLRFWQHLSNAGLISGNYTGVEGSFGAGHAVPGENVPATKFGRGGGWTPRSIPYSSGDSEDFAYSYGQCFRMGAQASYASSTWFPLFTPEELWNIDTKIDDGRPAQGNVIANWWDDCTDAADEDGLTSGGEAASYLLSETGVVCSAFFANAF